MAEPAAGGLINAALLAVPGASGRCLGGAVLYTRQSRLALKGMHEDMFKDMTDSTEVYALFIARAVRERPVVPVRNRNSGANRQPLPVRWDLRSRPFSEIRERINCLRPLLALALKVHPPDRPTPCPFGKTI